MATLFNTKIKDTYQSLLKLEDNTILTTTTKNVTDGLGNASPLFMSTTQVRIGSTSGSAMYWDNVNNRLGIGTSSPTSTFEVAGNVRILNNGGLTFYNGNSIFSSHYITTANEILTVTSNNSHGAWKFTNYNVSIDKNLAIGTTLTDFVNASQRLLIKGSGSTSATTSLLVQNSGGNAALTILDDRTSAFGSNVSISPTAGGTIQLGVDPNIMFRITDGSGYQKFSIARGLSGGALSLSGGSQGATSYNLSDSGHIFSFPSSNNNADTVTITRPFRGNINLSTINLLNITSTNEIALSNATLLRGLYINPTVTDWVSVRAIETTAGNVIFNGGNVGIGTSSPTNTLDVNGTARVSGALTVNTSTVNNIIFSNVGTSSSSYMRWLYNPDNTNSVKTLLYIHKTGLQNGSTYIAPTAQSGNDTYAPTGNNNYVFGGGTSLTTGQANVFIGNLSGGSVSTGSSNVFIGKGIGGNSVSTGLLNIGIAPEEMLSGDRNNTIVIGNISNGGVALDIDNAAVIGGMRINTLYVGAYKTTLPGSAYYQTNFTIASAGGSGTDIIGTSLTLAGGRGTGTGTPGSLIFSTSTATTTGTTLQTLSERMRITGTGNVGVGEASPTARLQVKGSGSTSATTSLLVQNSGATTILSVNDAGNATIGGTLTTGDDIVIGNIGVGKGKSTGIYNTTMGNGPLASATSSSTVGYTVAIGRTAGFAIASGIRNVIIGTETVQQSGSVSNSVIIGTQVFMGVTSTITDTLAIGTGDNSNYHPTIYATNINGNSPNVRIGNNSALTAAVPTAPKASAILELSSTTKGFLPPQMTTAQKNAISSPANGLMVYDTDLARPCFFNGATWITL